MRRAALQPGRAESRTRPSAGGRPLRRPYLLPRGLDPDTVNNCHRVAWYPDGLAGEAIPFKARIVCIVDAFDALLTPRSYQAAHSTRQALKILEGEAARLFDPELLEAFFLLMSPGKRMGLGPVAA
jgi:hypothetical protein